MIRFLIDKNRACQGLNETRVSGVVLNILRVRKENNRRLQHGGWEKKTPLSESAKQALESKKVSRSFFRRLRAVHPEIKPKNRHKVSVKCGLRCTEDMAIDYLDALARLLIEVGITPDLKQTAPGIWEGNIDVRGFGHMTRRHNLSTSMKVDSQRKKFLPLVVMIVLN